MRGRLLTAFVLMALAVGLQAAAQEAVSGVTFSHAFATPHRMTVGRPENSDRTLLDVEPETLRLAWSYESLVTLPEGAFVTPSANWSVKLTPRVDGQPFAASSWKRGEDVLPVLVKRHEDPKAALELEVTGTESATVVHITATNTSNAPVQITLACESQRGFFGYNPGYINDYMDHDCLLAGWGERADRIIAMGIGAERWDITAATVMNMAWQIEPGQTKSGWIVRPYRHYEADLAGLRAHDWAGEVAAAKAEWKALLGSVSRVTVPDPGVEKAFYASLGDCFIMREPIAGGRIASVPGTEGYRAANSGEAAIVAIVLDQLGLHQAAADGFAACLEWQGEDGNWADPKGWGHLMWIMPGFKAWAIREHYLITRDRAYLESVYPRLLASTRWQEKQRARMRVLQDGVRPVTYGLMPRGMGDCGLKDGDDLYGVFLPSNIWSVYADGVTLEAAQALGRTEEAAEVRGIYETALADLRAALDKGAIQEDGYRWIPGVAGKTCGSRWGALNVLTPCNILPAEHELVEGTLKYIESNMSPGGLPLNTGWLPAGLWVAIALDNLAEAHLVRNEGDAAARLLYATLNHGTPLYTYCEERAPEPGATQCTGDRQHLWTPVAIVRALRDMLVMEDGDGLHLARGIDRRWLASGSPVGIDKAATYYGVVSWEMRYDAASKTVTGKAVFPPAGQERPCAQWATLHVRLPEGLKAVAVGAGCTATVLADGSGIRWEKPAGEMAINVLIQ